MRSSGTRPGGRSAPRLRLRAAVATAVALLAAAASVPAIPPFAAEATAAILTVQQDGSGDFLRIQDAIDASRNDDVIEVGPGVYREDLILGGRRIELRSTEGPEKTVIDGGDSERSIVTLIFNETRSTRIRGFTMRNGRGTPLNAPGAQGGRHGGAVLCNPGSATFENVRFADNFSNRGGAFFAGPGSAPRLIDCVFENNVAGEGGALACFGSGPLLEDVTFVGNQAVYGGAIHSAEAALACRGGVFIDNVANEGGAVYARDSAATEDYLDSTFWKNLGAEGAAIRAVAATLRARGSVFAENHFPGFAPAQVAYTASTGAVTNNVFFSASPFSSLVALTCDGGAIEVACNVSWPGPLLPDPRATGANGALCAGSANLRANPLFCDPAEGDFRVRPDSPCLPENSSEGCGRIGLHATSGCARPLGEVGEMVDDGTDVQALEERKREPSQR